MKGAIIVAMLVLVAGFTILIPERAEGQTIIPVVTVAINPSSKIADVAPGSPTEGMVTFDGTVTCDSGSQTQVTVSLQVAAGGWGAALSPTSMTFPPGTSSQSFSLSVRAPPGTSHKITQQVIVSGTWTSAEGLVGDVNPGQCMVIIKQYFKIVIEADNPYVEVSPGDQVTFSLKIWNMGNDEDDFQVTIENEKSLTDEGWTVPTVGKITVQEKETRPIKITVNTPQDWTLWKNKVTGIRIRVTSERSILQNPDQPVYMDYTLYVRQKGFYLPAYDPMIMIFGFGIAILLFSRRMKEGE